MLFIEKYKPTNQRALFNQVCVNNIKKWIKALTNDDNFKKILYLHSEHNSCGKKSTIAILFKKYNIVNIDSDSLRNTDNLINVCKTIPSFNSNSLSIFDCNIKNKHEGNIVFINNIKHCDKTINQFIDLLYKTELRNIPIILTCNDKTIRNKFNVEYETTFIDFNKPTLNDFYKIASQINDAEQLSLNHDEIIKVIETTLFDINQLFHILEHIKYNANGKNVDLDTLKKDNDIDMTNKMEYLFDFNNEYNYEFLEEITQSDTNLIISNIYQNYIKLFLQDKKKKNDEKIIEELDLLSKISDTFCFSMPSEMDNDLFSNEHSEYNSLISCITPVYHLHEYNKKSTDKFEKIKLISFKTINYNNSLSFSELKSQFYKNNNNLYGNENSDAINNIISLSNDYYILWYVFNIVIDAIENIKLNDNYKQFITDFVWNYTLFEGNNNINKIIYKKEELKLDLSLFKKFINSFTFKKKIKTVSDNDIINDIKDNILTKFKNNKNTSIENLIYNLDDIWECLKN